MEDLNDITTQYESFESRIKIIGETAANRNSKIVEIIVS